MSSASELPKIQDSLKGEILSPRKLKETTVREKNMLQITHYFLADL